MNINEKSWGEQGIEPQTDFIERFDLDIRSVDWFTAPGPGPDMEEVVEESDEWIVKKDAWGASFKTWKYKVGTPEHVDFSVTSPDVWNSTYREAFVAIDVREHVDLDSPRARYEKAMAGDRFTTYSSLFVVEELRKVLGDLSMLESLLLEPDWIADFCTCITRKYLDYFELIFSEVGLPDGMHIYDDLGYAAAPFASPQCHRELIHPHHETLFRMFKDYNLPIILHTCGDFRAHLRCIVESGVDCIQAMEAKTGMDVVELAGGYKNELYFMGNINIEAIESGDRDKIREECLAKMNGMKKLRAPYVYMSDHSIPPSVKPDDYEYVLELHRDNCAY